MFLRPCLEKCFDIFDNLFVFHGGTIYDIRHTVVKRKMMKPQFLMLGLTSNKFRAVEVLESSNNQHPTSILCDKRAYSPFIDSGTAQKRHIPLERG